MNIFSPVAWKQFFDAWKKGDFKKNKKKEKKKTDTPKNNVLGF